MFIWPCSCWTEEPSGVGQGGDHYVFEKLVRLFEGRSLNWEGLVELAEQAKLGDTFVLRWAVCDWLVDGLAVWVCRKGTA